MFKSPQLVVFDLYGTLVKFGITHHPYRKILRWAHTRGRKPLDTDARTLMTRNESPEETFQFMGIDASAELLQVFRNEIHEELNSLTLFDDVLLTLKSLESSGIELAICSNLANPYGEIIDRLLSEFSFSKYLSYEIGFIKPENQMYDAIVKMRSIRKEEILFVGDTLLADYEGPIKYGFQARHLCRTQASHDQSIQSLKDILRLFSEGM